MHYEKDYHALTMKHIDLTSSIKESDSEFLKKLPAFVVRRLERIIKQDEINTILDKYADCEGADFHRSIMKEFNITLEVEGWKTCREIRNAFSFPTILSGLLTG